MLFAQSPVTPDLSGTWKVNLEKSKLPKGSTLQSETLIINCSGPTIQMHYTTDGKAWSQTYTADGKEKKISENQGGEIFVKARWKGPHSRRRIIRAFEIARAVPAQWQRAF